MTADIPDGAAAPKKQRSHAARNNPSATADLVLADGRAINFDLGRISIKEYRALFVKSQPQAEEDELVARVAGLTVEQLLALSQPDYRRLLSKFLKKAREPLADPN